MSIAWLPKGKSTWFDCLRAKGVRQLHAVARSPTTHKRLRLFESPVLIIHLEVTEGSWADPYLLETCISFGGRTSSFSRAALILPGSACNRQKNSLRQGSGLCRLPARVKHLKTRTSLDWFKKKLGETIVSYHEIEVCLVFLPVNVEAKKFWKAVSRWHLPPRSWPFQWPALRLMWSVTNPMAMKNPSFSSVSSQLSQLAMFDCQRVPILSAASLCVECLFEPPGTSWTPNSARRSSDFKRSSRSSSQRKRRCSNDLIPRCSHQNSWYLWMFIPFKIKKNDGEFVSVFSRSQYGFGWGSRTFGAFKSWDDLIFSWIPRYSTRETPRETTWSCDTTPLILTKSSKSSKSSKSWSFSSLCFCACCRRLDLGPQITITFQLCFVSDGVPTPPVGWELRDQQPSEVMSTQNNNRPKRMRTKK